MGGGRYTFRSNIEKMSFFVFVFFASFFCKLFVDVVVVYTTGSTFVTG